MLKFKDFFKVPYPEKTKVKFNMNVGGDPNRPAWDCLANGEDDPDWIGMNSWKEKKILIII